MSQRIRRLGALIVLFLLIGMLAAGAAVGAVTRYQEDHPSIVYGPTAWTPFSYPAGSSGAYSWPSGIYRYTSNQAGTAQFTFTGTRIKYFDGKGPMFGILEVQVNDGPWVSVDCYHATVIRQVELFDSQTPPYGPLPYGTHTLRVRNTSSTNATASPFYQIGVDFFDVFTPETITASAGSNGSISPAGSVSVDHDADQTFTITPDVGYEIEDVLVDGSSAGAVGSYTFTGVTGPRTISATFSAVPVVSTTASSPWTIGVALFSGLAVTVIARGRRRSAS